MATADFTLDVGVIGGGGRIGLPLALLFTSGGLRTLIQDLDAERVRTIREGRMPFEESGAQELLDRALAAGHLSAEVQTDRLAECRYLVCIIGTPVDEHLNPNLLGIQQALEGCVDHLRDGQTLILRSTIYPGISEHVQRFLKERGLDIGVAFCPERVAQGKSLEEFRTLPQIVSAFDEASLASVKELFGRFGAELIEMAPMEAELAKLMTNSWRYLQFAAANQFYMIASEHGLDFDRILHGCRHDYPRMAGMPGPGFAAGPCLVKDTMQLAAFSRNNFILGHSAMLVNEGLPMHLVQLTERTIDLSERTTGILGMAFKADSDDERDSLSYKLKRLLTLHSRRVLCTDPQVRDERLVPLEQVLEEAEVIFVGAPHAEYRGLRVPAGKHVVDVWGCLGEQQAASQES